MKNLTLFCLFFAIILSASAQEAKHDLIFKAYITAIKSNHPSGNTAYYGFSDFQMGRPALALAITRGKGSYHQIELCDLKLEVTNQNYVPETPNNFSLGFRYSYNVSLLKTQTGKLKTFIGLGTHVLTNYLHPIYASRYTTINAELNVTPTVSYSLSQHFSIEANFPLTFFEFTEEIYPSDRQDNPNLGAQYFYGRIGVAFNP